MRFVVVLSLLVLSFPPLARAQEAVWVQIEAVPTLSLAQSRAQDYALRLSNVNGFRLSTGWYAIALGPFDPGLARAELVALRRAGEIPGDSYIAQSEIYQQQFWPVGGTALTVVPLAPRAPDPLRDGAAQPVDPGIVYIPDESPAEARRSERLLTGAERRELQEALQWFGKYTAAIDGAFGPGTRRAMTAWQAAQGYDETGILTTGQRRELLAAWRAPFDALGLRRVRNAEAGIEMTMPMAKVELARVDAPFVQYDSRDDSGMRMLLISQSGDEATLFGLYDIMQTLEIVPPDGPRERRARQFTLRGTSPDLSSYTFARLEDGAVKGFTLIWRDEDPRVIESVLETMRDSFTVLPAVLPDTAREGEVAEPSIDLMSGLEIRRPERVRTGFYVDRTGAVLTSTEAVGACGRITLDERIEVEVAASDASLGLALLRPAERLAPIAYAAFRSGRPRLRAEVAVAGYSYGDALRLPLLTYGTLADMRGLDGEDWVARLDLAAQPGDGGGPVFDSSGAVLGMLKGGDPGDATRRLPPGVSFAVDVPAIAGFLAGAGLEPTPANGAAPIAPEDLADLAADMAVRVSCWN